MRSSNESHWPSFNFTYDLSLPSRFQSASVNRLHFLYNRHLLAGTPRSKARNHRDATGVPNLSTFYEPKNFTKYKNDAEVKLLLGHVNRALNSRYLKHDLVIDATTKKTTTSSKSAITYAENQQQLEQNHNANNNNKNTVDDSMIATTTADNNNKTTKKRNVIQKINNPNSSDDTTDDGNHHHNALDEIAVLMPSFFADVDNTNQKHSNSKRQSQQTNSKNGTEVLKLEQLNSHINSNKQSSQPHKKQPQVTFPILNNLSRNAVSQMLPS